MKNSFKNLAIASAMILSACGGSSRLQLSDKNFAEVIELQQNLIFNFNKDLMPDSLCQLWDTTEFIKFTPLVKGKFQWTSTSELVFSPDFGFSPSTNYKAEFTEKLLDYTAEVTSLPDERIINFHTPYLTLLGTDVFWTKTSGKIQARINLNFNYRVNHQELTRLLHIIIDGKERDFTMKSSSMTNTIEVIVEEPTNKKFDNLPLKIVIDKGLKCVDSDWINKEKIEMTTKLPDKGKLQITQVTSEHDGERGIIHVYTNQGVEGNIRSQVSFQPYIAFKIEKLEYGFLIKGDFKTEIPYELKISKNLKGIFGTSLGKDHEQFVIFGEVEPEIRFTSKKALYLSSKGAKNVGIKIINVAKVKVKVYKIYKNNILAFLKNTGAFNTYYDDYYDDYYYYGRISYETWGDVVLEQEYKTKNLKKLGGISLLNLDFSEISQFKGIFVVEIRSSEDRWLKANKTVVISDVGLIVKETKDEILVFANSVLTAEPLSGIDIGLVSSNNQFVYNVTTGKDGVSVFKNIPKNAPGFNIKMVTAMKDEDFTYLHFKQSKVEISRYEVGGRRENPAGYQAFIYGDRNIYRPGETIHINTIIRNEKWEPVGNIPIKLKLLLPNGKEYTSIKGKLNSQGAFETSINLSTSCVTGTYTLEVYSTTDVLLNSESISVEEFMPDRIKVNVTLNKKEVKPGEKLQVSATALNLFGPPATGRNYEMDMKLSRKYFSSKGFEDYNFYIDGANYISFDRKYREGKTDENGMAVEEFYIGDQYENMGILSGKIYVTVFDETGRPVNRINTFDVITQDVFYGIKYFDTYVATNKVLKIPLIAINKDGKTLSKINAKIQIIKRTWHTVIEKKSSGKYRYVSQKKEEIMDERNININGLNTYFPFTPTISGEYEIRISKQGTDSYVKQYFYAYGWGRTQTTSFEVDKEGKIRIELDKEKYKVGDEANILFKTPFPGRLLITIERNKVFDYFYVNTDKKSANISIPVKDEYLPNVYITATLIKPVTDDAIPLTVAHGFVPLFAEKQVYKLPVTIQAVEKSRSKTKQKIGITVEGHGSLSNIELTVAVVDEGILQIKNYQTPDPYKFFFQKRALEVNSYDLYLKLFPELKISKESFGAGGYDLEKRVNPLTNKRVKLLAFWSGIIKTNSKGKAYYTIDIPQFSGDLRIMVVAYKDKAFGAAEKHMKVADPVVVSTALPRFLSPGDTVLVPVTITNTTAKNTSAKASISVKGPLKIIGKKEQSVNLKANSERQVQFKVYSKREIGAGEVKVVINALNEKFTEKIDITVRPTTSLLKISGSGIVSAGKSEIINLGSNFIPSTVEARLIISKSPMIQFTEDLNYLLGYPYGCIEQTVSKAFPQIYFHDLVKSIGIEKMQRSNPNYNVQEAIRKIQTMQLYDGSFSYWPGGSRTSWWSTVYATHFLYEAKKAGFEVDAKILDRVFSYIEKKVKNKKTENYYYYDENNIYRNKKIAPKENFYSLYVLALSGKHDLSTMNYYKSRTNIIALDCRYMLACTYLLSGDVSSFRTLLPQKFAGEKSKSVFGRSFHSYIRDEAIALNALLEADPKNVQIGIMARHLSQQMKKKRWLSTQERTFAIIAMGKLAKLANKSNITADVKVKNKIVATFNDNDLILTKGIKSQKVTINAKGQGMLYYFWEVEGLSTTGEYKQEDSFIKVRKSFYDRYGRSITNNTFRQNDLIVVRLTIYSLDNSKVENVVITDMLPAGFEIENPRINTMPNVKLPGSASYPEHFDIRDDRINMFTTVRGSAKNYYYVVRAVSKGIFQMGPVSADAMYNGEYHSYHGAGTVKIY